MCKMHAALGVFIRGWIWGTFVEGHDDICAYFALDVHDAFRGEQMFGPVDVAGEGGAFLGDFTLICQAIYLVAPTICEYGAVPADEFVESIGGLKNFCSWAQEEVVGVP